jgi:nicotinamide-nucleotide amidase
MQAIILSIGDELVLGQTVDTNSAYLSAKLAQRGIGTLYHQTVADDQAMIATAIAEASQRAELVIISGGLGPTEDDLTRQALADAMKQPLVLDDASVEAIRAFFTARGREMPDRNKVQALHPQGTTIITNTCGTAPGIKARFNRATIYITPGVPRELFTMFRLSIEPELEGLSGERQVILTATIHTFGLGESTVGDMLGDLMDRKRNPKVGTTVSGGLVGVRVRSEFADPRHAQEQMDDTIRQVEAKLGRFAFGRDEQSLQGSLVRLLQKAKLTLATAESCTAGGVGQMITDVPGSSDVYLGGWVTYANALKQSQLGVSEALLATHGAVSGEVARAMAQGALSRSGADLAVSITGIAGPGGGSEAKPVGTVWIGLAARGQEPQAWHFHLPGDRDTVRDRAAKCALQALRFQLLGESVDRWSWAKAAVKVS